MSGRGTFSNKDPQSFASRWRTVAVDGVTVGEWLISPVFGSCMVGDNGSGVVLIVVTKGMFHCEVQTGTGVFNGTPDAALVLAASDTIRFSIPTATRMLRVEIPTRVAPLATTALSSASLGSITPSRLTSDLMSLVEVVLDPVDGGTDCAAARTIRALSTAVLEEISPHADEDDQRTRIMDHIERHLSEPDLGPQSIASTFGISLRWVHQLFSRDGESLARYIKHRRLDLIAQTLQNDHRFPKISALASRYGFLSRDQLTRAFTARFGMPIREYAARAASGHAPEPPSP